jgi:alanine racemase
MHKLSVPNAAIFCMARLILVLWSIYFVSPIGIGEAAGPDTPEGSHPITMTPTHGMTQGGNPVFIDVMESAADPSTLHVSCQFGEAAAEAGEFNPKINQHICKAPPHPIPETVNVTIKVNDQTFDMGRAYTYTTFSKQDMPILTINTDVIQENLRNFKRAFPPDVLLGAVLKNGDPVGLLARTFADATDIGYFFVPRLQDGIELREAGVKNPISIMYLSKAENIPLMLYYDLEPAASSLTWVKQANQILSRTKGQLNVHLWVDTGMGREGVMADEALPLARSIQNSPHLKLKGIATHLCCVGPKDAKEFNNPNTQNKTVLQKRRFDKTIEQIRNEGIGLDAIIHAGASDVIRHKLKPLYYDMLRIGDLLFENKPDHESTYNWKTKIQQVKTFPKGWCIDYGCETVVKKATRVGLISHISSDDDSVKFSVKGEDVDVLLDHETVVVLDLSEMPNVQEGEEVTIHFDPSTGDVLDTSPPLPVTLRSRMERAGVTTGSSP